MTLMLCSLVFAGSGNGNNFQSTDQTKITKKQDLHVKSTAQNDTNRKLQQRR